MSLIKEPKEVDFYTTGQQMTEEDQRRVSEYIFQQKQKRRRRGIKSKKDVAR